METETPRLQRLHKAGLRLLFSPSEMFTLEGLGPTATTLWSLPPLIPFAKFKAFLLPGFSSLVLPWRGLSSPENNVTGGQSPVACTVVAPAPNSDWATSAKSVQ